jgi:hypothetical protein
VEIQTKLQILWSASFKQCFREQFEQVHHSVHMADRPLRSSSWIFVSPSLNIPLHRLTVLSLGTFWPQTAHSSRRIPYHLCFSLTNADNNPNFAARGITIHKTLITHSVETRTNITWPVMWWYTRSNDANLQARALSRSYISWVKQTNVTFLLALI